MKFDRYKFTFDRFSGYLKYNNEFVARFKYRGPVTAAKFKAVLIKHYTVEGYMERLKTHTETPLGILERDGFFTFENGKFILDGKVLN